MKCIYHREGKECEHMKENYCKVGICPYLSIFPGEKKEKVKKIRVKTDWKQKADRIRRSAIREYNKCNFPLFKEMVRVANTIS